MGLYTVTIHFADRLDAIGQYDADSPIDALKLFIRTSESLEHYDRGKVEDAIRGLIHLTDPLKGYWSIVFEPLSEALSGVDGNPILGGQIIQTDPNAPTSPMAKYAVTVAQLYNEYDPMGLIAGGAPQDEHASEIRHITFLLSKADFYDEFEKNAGYYITSIYGKKRTNTEKLSSILKKIWKAKEESAN